MGVSLPSRGDSLLRSTVASAHVLFRVEGTVPGGVGNGGKA